MRKEVFVKQLAAMFKSENCCNEIRIKFFEYPFWKHQNYQMRDHNNKTTKNKEWQLFANNLKLSTLIRKEQRMNTVEDICYH